MLLFKSGDSMYIRKNDQQIIDFVKSKNIDTEGFYVLTLENYDRILNPIKRANSDEEVIDTIDKEIVEFSYTIKKVKSNDIHFYRTLYNYYYEYYNMNINDLLIFEAGNKFYSKNKEYLLKYAVDKISNYNFILDKLKDELYDIRKEKDSFTTNELIDIIKEKRLDIERIIKQLPF